MTQEAQTTSETENCTALHNEEYVDTVVIDNDPLENSNNLPLQEAPALPLAQVRSRKRKRQENKISQTLKNFFSPTKKQKTDHVPEKFDFHSCCSKFHAHKL